MTASVVEEYRALIDEANGAAADVSPRTVERLRREFHRIASRDHFAPKEHETARRAIERLGATLDPARAGATRR
jgi:hypothetical protein